MATTYDRLVAAGAPVVAEPMFFRVRQTDVGDLVVDLRVRNERIGSRLLARKRAIQDVDIEESPLEAVVRAMNEALDAHEDYLDAIALVGEYPSKENAS